MRSVSYEEAQHYADDNNMFFFETSSLNASNIDLLFQTLATKVARNKNQKKNDNKVQLKQVKVNPTRKETQAFLVTAVVICVGILVWKRRNSWLKFLYKS